MKTNAQNTVLVFIEEVIELLPVLIVHNKNCKIVVDCILSIAHMKVQLKEAEQS